MIRLQRTGEIKWKNAAEIEKSRFGIGFEKLDRAVFDPEKAYDRVAETGVKRARIQSGWMRTEKEKGKYDFGWLDMVVDNLNRRGVSVWACLCYGNPVYDDFAKDYYGAVGCPPIHTGEALDGWLRYCSEVAKRYREKIFAYEIWNEPNGKWCWKSGVSAEEYGAFAAATAKVIRAADPDAEIYAGALTKPDPVYATVMLAKDDMYKYIDGVTFHAYTPDDFSLLAREKAFIALVRSFDPRLKVIQGESGTQSRFGGAGALNKGLWDEKKQAKLLLRHLITDIEAGVDFASYFTTVDMIEALKGLVADKGSYLDYGYFGVLAAQFDEDGISCGEYSPKPSFFALRTLCTALSGDCETRDLPVFFTPERSDPVFGTDCADATLRGVGFERPDGSAAFAYWNAVDLMTCDWSGTETLTVYAPGKNISLLDLYDGGIYAFPDSMKTELSPGVFKLTNIPIRDYPLLLLIGDFWAATSETTEIG